MSGSLDLRAFLADTHTPLPVDLRDLFARTGTHSLRELLETNRDAAWVPWHGASVATVMDNPGVNRKVTIVVLADGYGIGSQHEFVDTVHALFTDLFGIDFYAENKASFRVVRVGLVSQDDQQSTPEAPRDNAIGLVYSGTFGDAGFATYTEDVYRRIAKAVRVWGLDGDVVAVQAHTTGADTVWGKWSSHMMALSSGLDAWTLAHELGHCFGLDDEYVGKDFTAPGKIQTWPADTEPGAPNLTAESDRTKVKWRQLIAATTPVPTPVPPPAGWESSRDVGLFEGGERTFLKGVYRPSDMCRMRDATTTKPRFCRVCQDAVSSALSYAIDHDGRPAGGGQPPGGEGGAVGLTVARRSDGSQVIIGIAPVRGSLLGAAPAAGARANVVWRGDRILGAAPSSSSVTAHAFRAAEPHLDVDEELEVFEVAVPADLLDGADPAELRFGTVVLEDDAPGLHWTDAVARPSSRVLIEPTSAAAAEHLVDLSDTVVNAVAVVAALGRLPSP